MKNILWSGVFTLAGKKWLKVYRSKIVIEIRWPIIEEIYRNPSLNISWIVFGWLHFYCSYFYESSRWQKEVTASTTLIFKFEFSEEDVIRLNKLSHNIIKQYSELVNKNSTTDFVIYPKLHTLTHYGELLKKYGAPVLYCVVTSCGHPLSLFVSRKFCIRLISSSITSSPLPLVNTWLHLSLFNLCKTLFESNQLITLNPVFLITIAYYLTKTDIIIRKGWPIRWQMSSSQLTVFTQWSKNRLQCT